jgi:hypothetical protein
MHKDTIRQHACAAENAFRPSVVHSKNRRAPEWRKSYLNFVNVDVVRGRKRFGKLSRRIDDIILIACHEKGYHDLDPQLRYSHVHTG